MKRVAPLLSVLATLAALAAPPIAAAAGVQRIAYVTEATLGRPQVWVAGPDGRGSRRLGPGDFPVLSPSGSQVAAEVNPTQHRSGSTVLYRAKGGPARTLLRGLGAGAYPLGFSADGRYLAVQVFGSGLSGLGSDSLRVVRIADGRVRTIASGQIFGASWSPPASPDRLVYSRAKTSSATYPPPADVYVSGPDGAHRARLTHDGSSVYPRWGPSVIAFSHETRRRNDAPVYQLWLMAPNGTGRRQLTHVPVPSLVSGLTAQAFSADGSRLLATFGGQDTDEAWTVDVASGSAAELNGSSAALMAAGLSADGNTVLAVSGAPDDVSSNSVVTVPFAGGTPTLLVAHGFEASWNLGAPLS